MRPDVSIASQVKTLECSPITLKISLEAAWQISR